MTTLHLLMAKALRVQAPDLAQQWSRLCADDRTLPDSIPPPLATAVIEAFAGVLDDGVLAGGLDQRVTQTVQGFATQVGSTPVAARQLRYLGQVLRAGTAHLVTNGGASRTESVITAAVELAVDVAERHLAPTERTVSEPRGAPAAAPQAELGNGHHVRPLAPKPDATPIDLERKPIIRRRLLVLLDFATVLVTSYAAMLATRGGVPTTMSKVASVLAYSVTCIVLIAFQRLYLARVSAIRALEVARLARVMLLAGLCGLAIDRVFDPYTPAVEVALRAALGFLGLAVTRGAFRAWLHRGRKRDDPAFISPVIIVGTNEEAMDLYRLMLLHPEFGYRVKGFIGHPTPDLERLGPKVLGDFTDLDEVLKTYEPKGALVAPSGIPLVPGVNDVVRKLLAAECHIHLSSGLRGIHHRRIVSHPLAYESLLYLEQLSFPAWQRRLKRGLDLVLGSAALVISLPVIAVAAVAIWLQDRGSVIFRQKRVGLGGEEFEMYKFRTMESNAEQRLAELKDMNERRGGPLFKLDHDPRVTRVGKLLRDMDIDELPQLVNVLKGDMSLVGPRPALPTEVERFANTDLHKHRYGKYRKDSDEGEGAKGVRPGMTGLWQDRARHNPSFESYERWDGFYVENWSVMLDFAILFSTAKKVAWRSVTALFRLVTGRGKAAG